MSDIKARFVGHPDGVHLTVPVSTEGEPPRHITVPYNGELPTDIDGHKVPVSFRDELLDQKDNWTSVRRTSKAADKAENATTAKADEKGE